MFLIAAFIVVAALAVGEYEKNLYAARDQEAAQALLDDLHSTDSQQ